MVAFKYAPAPPKPGAAHPEEEPPPPAPHSRSVSLLTPDGTTKYWYPPPSCVAPLPADTPVWLNLVVAPLQGGTYGSTEGGADGDTDHVGVTEAVTEAVEVVDAVGEAEAATAHTASPAVVQLLASAPKPRAVQFVQAWHVVAPARLNLPVPQTVQTLAPVASALYVPAPHAVHTTAVLAPEMSPYAPAPHDVHAADVLLPPRVLYVPRGQEEHTAAAAALYMPATQDVHTAVAMATLLGL